MRLPTVAALGLLACACGASPTRPTPLASSSVVFTTVSPPSGSAIAVPEKYVYIVPGGAGVIIPPHSGLISFGVSLTSAHEVPWAQLNVYLLTSDRGLGYCGQNLPDSPTWSFLPPGWTTAVTVSGFQVFRLPCEVTGIRAMLHMRNNGSLTPPTPSETIAEATLPVSYRILR